MAFDDIWDRNDIAGQGVTFSACRRTSIRHMERGLLLLPLEREPSARRSLFSSKAGASPIVVPVFSGGHGSRTARTARNNISPLATSPSDQPALMKEQDLSATQMGPFSGADVGRAVRAEHQGACTGSTSAAARHPSGTRKRAIGLFRLNLGM
jgi:hypothetical protein